MRYTLTQLTLLFHLLFFSFLTTAQNLGENSFLNIQKIETPITLDGILDEEIWKTSDRAKDFWQNQPADTLFAIAQTEAMVAYDDENLYVAAICYDTLEGDYVIESLRRDFNWIDNDNFSFYVDPMNDRTNGFTFQLSALGVQREGMIIESQEINQDWDNKWYSAVQNEEDRWTLEMRIPFKSFRYSENIQDWNITFLRNYRKGNEMSSWTKVAQQYFPNNLTFAGKLNWSEPPPKAGTNVSFIPYIASGVSRNFEDGESIDANYDVGFDAKVAVSSSLNLDLTVNPDFSQVEVDQQVTNLERFEIFFPERRQFFLENSDLFSNFGAPPLRPFFSRRIGIAQDRNGNTVQAPILFGARLSGKLDQNWRIGLLNMQTAKDDDLGTIAQNYSVAAVQRRVWSRSNIGAIFVNRQAVNFEDSDGEESGTKYNRLAGVDFNFASKDNRWNGKFFSHYAFSPEGNNSNYANAASVSYNSRNLSVFYVAEAVGKNFNPEVGFAPRNGFYKTFADITTTFYPKAEWLISHSQSAFAFFLTDIEGNLTDREFSAGYSLNFSNTSSFFVGINNSFIKLTDPFDPSNTGGAEYEAGTEFDWTNFEIGYSSDQRKRFNFEGNMTIGELFSGKGYSFEGSINYRYQPYGSLAITANYTDIDFPEPFNDAQFWLVGPRFDLTFTDKLFFTTFIQYNEQIDNININSRFQWRFKPVSDLFIVYTDNYFPNSFEVKNRALVVKLSYWFNL